MNKFLPKSFVEKINNNNKLLRSKNIPFNTAYAEPIIYVLDIISCTPYCTLYYSYFVLMSVCLELLSP